MDIYWIFLIIIAIVITIWFIWGIISPHIWEQPQYKTEQKLNKVEIRRYKKANIIKTKASTPNNAFSILGGYIFGKNQEKEKIAMTTPVMTEISDNDTVNMTFFLPKKYRNEKIPTPLLEDIIIDTQDEKIVAILRFYGRMTLKKKRKYREKLIETLKANQIIVKGNAFYMNYADPFVPPPLRRNEVGIEIS